MPRNLLHNPILPDYQPRVKGIIQSWTRPLTPWGESILGASMADFGGGVHVSPGARAGMVARAVGLLAAASTAAAATLARLLAAEADGIKLSAARAILEVGGRLREAGEIEERIAALERSLDAGQGAGMRRVK